MSHERVWKAIGGFGIMGLLWTAVIEVAGLIGPGPHQLVGVDLTTMIRLVLLHEDMSWRGIWVSSAPYPGDAVLAFSAVAAVVLAVLAVCVAVFLEQLGQEGRGRLAASLASLTPEEAGRRGLVRAGLAGGGGLVAVWLIRPRAVNVLVVAAAVLLLALLASAWISGRGPHGLPTRVPRRLRVAPQTGWY